MNNIGTSTHTVGPIVSLSVILCLRSFVTNLFRVKILSVFVTNCGLLVYVTSKEFNNSGRHKSGNLKHTTINRNRKHPFPRSPCGVFCVVFRYYKQIVRHIVTKLELLERYFSCHSRQDGYFNFHRKTSR